MNSEWKKANGRKQPRLVSIVFTDPIRGKEEIYKIGRDGKMLSLMNRAKRTNYGGSEGIAISQGYRKARMLYHPENATDQFVDFLDVNSYLSNANLVESDSEPFINECFDEPLSFNNDIFDIEQ